MKRQVICKRSYSGKKEEWRLSKMNDVQKTLTSIEDKISELNERNNLKTGELSRLVVVLESIDKRMAEKELKMKEEEQQGKFLTKTMILIMVFFSVALAVLTGVSFWAIFTELPSIFGEGIWQKTVVAVIFCSMFLITSVFFALLARDTWHQKNKNFVVTFFAAFFTFLAAIVTLGTYLPIF